MAPLKKYLNPKSQWHSSMKDFPTKVTVNNIIKYLEKNEFKKLEHDTNSSVFIWTKLANVALKSNDKLYVVADYPYSNSKPFYWIRFCNPGQINEDNPIFFITATTNINISVEDSIGEDIDGIILRDVARTEDENGNAIQRFTTYEEFKQKLSRFF